MFKSKNFCHIASNNRNQVKVGVFTYRTTDSLATVLANGYFNERIIDINLHDLIIHEKIDALDNTKVVRNLLCVTERTLENVGTALVKSDWENGVDLSIADIYYQLEHLDLSGYVKTNGTSVMTGPLLMRATDDFKCAIAPYWDGVGFFKLNDNNSVTLMASLEYEDGLTPATDNKYNLGTSTKRWKDARIARVITATLNNGYDIAVPVTNSADTLALKSEVDTAANSGDQLYSTGVWYAKMYAATVVPTSAEYDGRNYADFSQVDSDNNPIIVIYTGASGAWTETTRITPPADYNGYMTITSKIWDIAEQSGQQGGKVLWSHNQKTFTPYPQIISFEGANITNGSFQGSADLSGTSTVSMPNNPGSTQIVNKDYVDTAISQAGDNSAKSIDAEVVGTLTVSDNGDVSGFSANDYLVLPISLYMTDATSFEIGVCFTTPGTTALGLNILENPHSILEHKIRIETNSDKKLYIVIHSGTNTQAIIGTTILQTSTKYYVKLVYDGTNYTLSLSTDGITYTTETTVTAIYLPGACTSPYIACPDNYIKAHMKDWYIKKNGILTYTGMGAPGLHQRASNRHEIIDSQAPTSSNNYTWYRKYADGWVEQGGYTTASAVPSGYITLAVEMASTDYWATSQWRGGSPTDTGNAKSNYNFCEPYSTTQILVGAYDTTHPCIWQVCGIAAS